MAATIPADLQDALHRYCASDPEKFGLYLSFCNTAGGGMSAFRSLIGLLRREVSSKVPFLRPAPGRLRGARVLFDATLGDKHAALWVPLALGLMDRGIPVGLALADRGLPADVAPRFPATGAPERLIVSEAAPAGRHNRSSNSLPPLRGTALLNARMLLRYASRMREAWSTILLGSPVTTVVTTSPSSPWSAAMVGAANDLGLKSVFLMQGFPSGVWGFPSCTTAVTWSPLGERVLREHGWGERAIIVACSPVVPDPGERAKLQQQGRARLEIPQEGRVILFLGQKSQDQAFAFDGYIESCRFIGSALAKMVGQGCHIVLRPHYGEGTGETAAVIRGAGVSSLIVSHDASLWEDLLAADVAVSLHSAALEEAWMAGVPIVQAVRPGTLPLLDFSVLRAHLAQGSDELVRILSMLLDPSEERRYGPESCGALRLADLLDKLAEEAHE
jgi:hypothetical protein